MNTGTTAAGCCRASLGASDNGNPLEIRSGKLEQFAAFAQVPATPLDAIDRAMRLIDERVAGIDGYAQLEFDRDYPLLFLTGRQQMVEIYVH